MSCRCDLCSDYELFVKTDIFYAKQPAPYEFSYQNRHKPLAFEINLAVYESVRKIRESSISPVNSCIARWKFLHGKEGRNYTSIDYSRSRGQPYRGRVVAYREAYPHTKVVVLFRRDCGKGGIR